tara:strand:- start:22 stop:1125 length:1104 start_codon:yes stop_codon:yes gene_type:complete
VKITVAKEDLVNGLQAVQNVVGARTTLPILSNVLLAAGEKRLELRATDLEATLIGAIEANVEQEGLTTLPAKRLFGLVREIESGEIEINVDGKDKCTIQSGASVYKLNGIPADDFPPLPKFKENSQVNLPQAKLKEMLRKVSYAISTDESRFVLNGVYFKLEGEKAILVATDGRRLALVEEEIEGGATGEFIVPSKAIGELGRLLGSNGEVAIRLGETQAEFTLTQEGVEPIKLFSKLVEGSYPNYKQVIPKESKERIPLVREEVLHALRRADQVTSDKANSVTLTFGDNNLTINANSPEVGEGKESIAINYKGDEIRVSFNPSFLMDPLKILESDEVYIELSDSSSPGVIKSNTPFLYVLMPMRTN